MDVDRSDGVDHSLKLEVAGLLRGGGRGGVTDEQAGHIAQNEVGARRPARTARSAVHLFTLIAGCAPYMDPRRESTLGPVLLTSSDVSRLSSSGGLRSAGTIGSNSIELCLDTSIALWPESFVASMFDPSRSN